jgi:hypothetical protein
VIGVEHGHYDIEIEHLLGSPQAPMSPEQASAKYKLARLLTGDVPDPRLFDDPVRYFTEPR